MKPDRQATKRTGARIVRAALLAMALLATGGCAERYLQTAQDLFSKGATIENQAILGDPAGTVIQSAPPPTALPSGALIYYADAHQNVRKALTKEQSALDQQGLTASALALQALVSWRLDDLQGSVEGGPAGNACDTKDYRNCARDSSAKALSLFRDQQFVRRDRFMMTIMPGLLDHNLGLRATATKPLEASNDFKSAFSHINDGFAVIEPVPPITGVPTVDQALKGYGLLAQYQVLRAWAAAIDQAAAPGAAPADQALTADQRRSCKAVLRNGRATGVIANINALDPQGVLISQNLRLRLASSLDVGVPTTTPRGQLPVAAMSALRAWRTVGGRALLAALIGLAALAAAMAPALAEDTPVNSGETVALETDAKKIENPVAQLGRLALTVAASGGTSTYTLKYTAPNVEADSSDTVTYSTDKGPVTKTFKIKPAPPQPLQALAKEGMLDASGKILVALLVLAIVLENALALLFNWRPFLETFDPRAVKPVVAFAVSYIFITSFNLDAVSALVTSFGGKPVNAGWLGLVITAMVVAGGSSAVNRLMQSLGVRLPAAAQDQTQRRPPPDHAWLSVTFRRKKATGRVFVMLQSIPTPAQPDPAQVIGSLDGPGTAGSRLFSYFFRSRSRFPPSGGYAVLPGTYKLWLEAPGGLRSETAWGPYAVATGALIDVELEL